MSINKLMPTTSDDGDLEIEELRKMKLLYQSYMAAGKPIKHLPAYAITAQQNVVVEPLPRKRVP
jgi:hypothetical protein